MDIKNKIIALLQQILPQTEQAIFAEKINRIRMQVNISATSSFRTHNRNRKVGGVFNSKHLSNLAIDVILDNNTDNVLLKRLCTEEQLTYLFEGDHIHIQTLKKIVL